MKNWKCDQVFTILFNLYQFCPSVTKFCWSDVRYATQRGIVDSPSLSLASSGHFWPVLATHSVCRRGKRCSHPSSLASSPKTTSGSNNQHKYCTANDMIAFVCISNISWCYLQVMIAIIMIVLIHPCWCPQWQYSGWNEAWKDSKGGAGRHWCSMQTVDLCPYIMHYRAGLFP